MKRVGTVVGVAQGVAVVRAKDADVPDFGTSVIDEDLETVGELVDIFGPVDRPYVAIAPDRDDPVQLVGDVLYARS